VPLAVASAVALALSYVLDWLHYLRLLGVLGLLTASLWTPWVLNRWRQRQSEYLHRWNKRNTESANELQATNPTYDPDGFRLWMKVWLTLRSIIVVVFALMLVFCMSFVLITVDNSLVTTPLCDTFFDEQDTATGGGLAGILGVECFESADSAFPWTDRGLLVMVSGIVAGLSIDLIYTNLFRYLAFWLARQQNVQKQSEYDNMRVRLLFPFEWAAFMSYFILAALLVPFSITINSWFQQVRFICFLELLLSLKIDHFAKTSSGQTGGKLLR
jgi:hypothetical protein